MEKQYDVQDLFEFKPKILEVKNLLINFKVYGGLVYAVRNVSFFVRESECLCIVGESGCGKSVSVQSIMSLLPSPPAIIEGGEALLNNKDLFKMNYKERIKYLGKNIAMIFQDPLTSLNPTMTIGSQIEEMLILHENMNKKQRQNRIIELLELVHIPEPIRRINQYPHEFSGGMRQRVMIAIALACNPQVLIADEPTTALDVTIQAQILSLIKNLAKKFNMATILITHDLGVVAQMADRVCVMYAGKVVEEGFSEQVFYTPAHPYTVGLKKAMPKDASDGDEALVPIPGTPPDLFSPPQGCAFALRCLNAMKICYTIQPEEINNGMRRASCWLHHEYVKEQRNKAGITSIDSNREAN